MSAFDDVIPGQMILVKLRVEATAENIWASSVSGYSVRLEEADFVEALDEPAPVKEKLKPGDRVRDGKGVDWMVMTAPMAVDGEKEQVSLWNPLIGGAWDFPDNLTLDRGDD
jgi:hypothetical protein